MPISAAVIATTESIARVNTAISVEQQSLPGAQAQKAEVAAVSTSISGLATKLGALSAAADVLADPAGILAKSVASTDPAVVAAIQATGSAAVGPHSVSVDQIATAQRTLSYGKNTDVDPLTMSGVLRMNVGAATADLSIVASDSLGDIATKINASGLRVSASVAFEDGAYKLDIRGLDTGAANTIAFTEVGDGPSAGTHSVLTLGLWRPSNTTQVARDALFSVDGVARSSATNQIKDVVPGVTLALTHATTSPATVTVSSDAVLRANLTTFVNAYNDVVTAGHAAAGYGSQPAAVPSLAGDSSVQSSLAQVASLLTTPVAGAFGAYTTLASIGLESDDSGLLHLRSGPLEAALAADPKGVIRLFAPDPSEGTTGAMSNVHSVISRLAGTSSSLLGGRLDGLSAQSRSLDLNAQAATGRLDTYRAALHDLLETLASQMNPPPVP